MQKLATNERSVATLGGQYRKFFAATIVATLFLQLTVVADTIIVGQLLGPMPMSGIRVAMPVVNLLNVLSALMGVGSATLLSIALGRRDIQTANRAFTAGIVLSVGLGLLVACIVAPLAGPIANAISSDGDITDYAATYLGIVVAASPVYILASVLAMLLRADGCIRLSSVVLVTGGGMNVVFDLVFMRALGMGVEGSAFATDVGMALACLAGMFYFRWPRRSLKLCNVFARAPRDDSGSIEGAQAVTPAASSETGKSQGFIALARGVFRNGAPGSLRLLFVSIGLMFMNYVVGARVGAIGIAFLTVCGNMQTVTTAFFSSGGQAAMPMEGVLFGERDYVGLKLLVRYVFKVVLIMVAIMICIVWIFPSQIIGLFGIGDISDTINWYLRLYSIGLAPLAFNYIMTYYYNVIQRQKLALAITACENIVFYLPLIWVLTHSFDLLGSVLAFVIAESLTVVMIVFASRVVARRTNTSSFLLMRETPDELVYDVTIEADSVGAADIARGVRRALESSGVEAIKANRAAVAAEEMVANAASLEANRKRSVYFDVRVFANPDGVRMTLRDNGASFDPTHYRKDEEDEFATDGIAVLHAVASNVSYRQVMGMNQTVIELDV